MCVGRLALAFACLMAVSVDRADAAYATSGWVEFDADLETCLRTGESAISLEGYSPSRGRTSAFGWRGEDNIIVRCIPEHGLVVIFVYALDNIVDPILDRMRGAFDSPTPPPKPR